VRIVVGWKVVLAAKQERLAAFGKKQDIVAGREELVGLSSVFCFVLKV